jgi:hypothetical protein
MSQQPALFPYLVRQPGLGPAGMAPMLPILLCQRTSGERPRAC